MYHHIGSFFSDLESIELWRFGSLPQSWVASIDAKWAALSMKISCRGRWLFIVSFFKAPKNSWNSQKKCWKEVRDILGRGPLIVYEIQCLWQQGKKMSARILVDMASFYMKYSPAVNPVEQRRWLNKFHSCSTYPDFAEPGPEGKTPWILSYFYFFTRKGVPQKFFFPCLLGKVWACAWKLRSKNWPRAKVNTRTTTILYFM